jgi:hypothetical protein
VDGLAARNGEALHPEHSGGARELTEGEVGLRVLIGAEEPEALGRDGARAELGRRRQPRTHVAWVRGRIALGHLAESGGRCRLAARARAAGAVVRAGAHELPEVGESDAGPHEPGVVGRGRELAGRPDEAHVRRDERPKPPQTLLRRCRRYPDRHTASSRSYQGRTAATRAASEHFGHLGTR